MGLASAQVAIFLSTLSVLQTRKIEMKRLYENLRIKSVFG